MLIFVNVSLAYCDGDEGYKIKVVVIDAGHGGKDPGAVCSSGYEKDLVLDIALKVGRYIEDNIPGVKVIYTRSDDTFVELYKRAQIANDAKADVFISIHANANESAKPFGAETYVMGLDKTSGNLTVAKKENSVILQEDNYIEQYEGFDPNSPESHIIFSLYQNAYLDQSLNLSSKIQFQFREKAKRTDRGVKQAGFLVLWKTAMPSLLVEVGFISNPEEAKYLFTDEGKDHIASAIYRAFKDYKNEQESMMEQEIQENDNNIVLYQPKDTILFKVQIVSSDKRIPVRAKSFKGLENVCENEIDGIYKYTVGCETDYNKILVIQKDIRRIYADAFVIAMKNGKKIPLNQALKEIKN
ncbi:MAG: N-acetylmuramoyl-L-alanine amidase [Bacteroidota bacterium]